MCLSAVRAPWGHALPSRVGVPQLLSVLPGVLTASQLDQSTRGLGRNSFEGIPGSEISWCVAEGDWAGRGEEKEQREEEEEGGRGRRRRLS